MRLIDADKLLEEWDERTDDHRITDSEFRRMINEDLPILELGWHYPSKGELPDRDGEYLCRYYKYDLRFSKVSFYRVKGNKWYNLVYDEEYRVPKPDAWQYIVPPKEEA